MTKEDFEEYAEAVGDEYPTLQREIQSVYEDTIDLVALGGIEGDEFDITYQFIDNVLLPTVH